MNKLHGEFEYREEDIVDDHQEYSRTVRARVPKRQQCNTIFQMRGERARGDIE